RHLKMPRHHDVRPENVDLNRLGAVLAVAYERDLHNFADFLLTEKLGPRTLQTLALVAEVIHGTPVRFSDPARYSFAVGGKDGHPFPVPLRTYDESIDVLRRSLDAAKMDGGDKLEGFRRLNQFVEGVETNLSPQADLSSLVAHELAISPALGGRSVQRGRSKPVGHAQSRQMSLF
ncbi:MAG: DUF763 domain-containing protein, partial [Acidobacteriota bacterium]|nr:DUF763 domain-containing protein [Acidobacteriota bacterium]